MTEHFNELEADGMCHRCNEDITEPHKCSDCGQEISEKECIEYDGLCYQCMWLLSK